MDKLDKINVAISRGIKLGIDLMDDDLQQDIDLQNEIQVTDLSRGFKPIISEIDIEYFIENIQDIISDYIFDKPIGSKNFMILRFFCCEDEYKKYVSIYKIIDFDKDTALQNSGTLLLSALITQLCKDFGNQINLNWIDVSQLKEMFYWKHMSPIGVFANSQFNGDISKWDVSNVINFIGMFANSQFNGDISQWKTKNAQVMANMFSGSKFNGDISHWNVSKVKNMDDMFSYSIFNGDISHWNVSHVKSMQNMFFHSKFNQDISHWKVKNVTNMRAMFADSVFDQDISQWEIRRIHTDTALIFDNCNISKEHIPDALK